MAPLFQVLRSLSIRVLACCFVVLAASCITAGAAEENAKAQIDPKAKKVLDAFDKYYAGLKGFQVAINVTISVEQEGKKQNEKVAQQLRMERPNKLLFSLESSQMLEGGGTIVSDGSQLSAYFESFKKYGQEKAPDSFDEMLENPLVRGAMGIGNTAVVSMALLDGHPAEKLLENLIGLKYGGLVKLGETPCHLLKATGKELDWQLWVDAGDKPLVRQFVPDLIKALHKMAQTEEQKAVLEKTKIVNVVAFADWKANPKFEDDAFAFETPDGVAKAGSLADIISGGRGPEEMGPHPLLGQAAPQIQLDLLDGSSLDLASYKGKKVVILDFWATWCGPCVKAMPIIDKVAEQYKDKDVLLFAVNIEEGSDDIKKFLEEAKLEVAIALDQNGEAAKDYKVSGIPQTVLIGKDGTVQVVHLGLLPNLEEQLTQELDALLEGKDLASATLAEAEEKAKAAEAEEAAQAKEAEAQAAEKAKKKAADEVKPAEDKPAAKTKPASTKADKAGKK